MKTVSWFSAGISSFVATHLINGEIDEVLFIDIDDHHPDTGRFVDDCAAILGREIRIMRSKLRSVSEACRAKGAIKFVTWAPCTDMLKRRVRKEWETSQVGPLCYVWGMDYDERDRADRIVEAMPKQSHRFPLIDAMMTKSDAHGYAAKLGLRRPAMYDLGYNNNNCIGCVKGGMGYWNKIRRDFPEVFAERSALERLIGHSILRECFLDHLNPDRGRDQTAIPEDCGIMCEIAFRGGRETP